MGVARAASAAEPYGEEALAYTKSNVLQKEVEIEVENMDRGGTAIGTLYVQRPMKGSGGMKRVNFATLLLQHGLAKVQSFSANLSPHGDALFAEEAAAKAAKINVWENFVEGNEENESTQANGKKEDTEGKLDTIDCTVCHINDGNSFFIQKTSAAGKAAMDAVNKAMARIAEEHGIDANSSGGGIMEPRKGQNVLALCNDGTGAKWYRAKIQTIDKEGGKESLVIQYIDFGNEEKVEKSNVRPASDPSVFSTDPLAVECCHAYVQTPGINEDYGVDAAVYLNELTMGKELEAKIHGKNDTGKYDVTLFPKESKDKIVGALFLREGLATIPRKARAWRPDEKEILKKLNESQEEAHQAHTRMWLYGDPRPDEDDQRF